jgi:hypothetical protein
MSLTRWLAVLLIALSVTARRPDAARASDPPPPPANKKPSTPPPSHAPKKHEKPTSFTGEVVKVAADAANDGRIWVKHANGKIEDFHIHAKTKISGAAALGAITKGSMVVVESIKTKAVAINVTKLAPPNAPDKVHGPPVTGTVTKVHSDAYGDTGNLAVKTSGGAVKEFQVTNATKVRHPKHPDFIHSFQFVQVGDTVRVEHDSGKIALRIEVTAVAK